MGKKKGGSGSGEDHYITTQANLDRKGKTNKKLKRNPMASKYLTSTGKEIKEKAEAYAKEHFKKGRRTRIKEQKAKEAAEKAAKEKEAKLNSKVNEKRR